MCMHRKTRIESIIKMSEKETCSQLGKVKQFCLRNNDATFQIRIKHAQKYLLSYFKGKNTLSTRGVMLYCNFYL